MGSTTKRASHQFLGDLDLVRKFRSWGCTLVELYALTFDLESLGSMEVQFQRTNELHGKRHQKTPRVVRFHRWKWHFCFDIKDTLATWFLGHIHYGIIFQNLPASKERPATANPGSDLQNREWMNKKTFETHVTLIWVGPRSCWFEIVRLNDNRSV